VEEIFATMEWAQLRLPVLNESQGQVAWVLLRNSIAVLKVQTLNYQQQLRIYDKWNFLDPMQEQLN
jgi:hypothetical protein